MITKDGQIGELAMRPRALGQRGELLVLTRGPGGNWWLFGAIFMCLFSLVGVTDSLVDVIGLFKKADSTAKITYVAETNTSVNEALVYEVGFAYELDGVALQGFAYSTDPPTEGKYVNLLVSRLSPRLVKPVGTDYGFLGTFGTVLCSIFLLSFVIAAFRTLKGSRWRKLLRNGVAAEATLKAKEPTDMLVNDQRVYKLHWTFPGDGGREVEHEMRTHLTSHYKIGGHLSLLYEEGNDKNVLFTQDIPEGLWLDRPGEWIVLDEKVKGIWIKLGITLFCLAVFAHKLVQPFVL